MTSKIIEIDGVRVIVALTEDGTPVAEIYKGAPPVDPGKVPVMKDKIAVADWLVSQGYTRGSSEYNARFAEMAQGLPLEQLTDKINL